MNALINDIANGNIDSREAADMIRRMSAVQLGKLDVALEAAIDRKISENKTKYHTNLLWQEWIDGIVQNQWRRLESQWDIQDAI